MALWIMARVIASRSDAPYSCMHCLHRFSSLAPLSQALTDARTMHSSHAYASDPRHAHGRNRLTSLASDMQMRHAASPSTTSVGAVGAAPRGERAK